MSEWCWKMLLSYCFINMSSSSECLTYYCASSSWLCLHMRHPMKFFLDNITIIQRQRERKFNAPVHMAWFLLVVLHLVLRLNQFNCVQASESLHTTSYTLSLTHTHTQHTHTHTHTCTQHFSLPHYSQASVTNPALSPVVRSFSAGLYFSFSFFHTLTRSAVAWEERKGGKDIASLPLSRVTEKSHRDKSERKKCAI